MHMTCFLNNFHPIPWQPKYMKAEIGHGYLSLKDIDISLIKLHNLETVNSKHEYI